MRDALRPECPTRRCAQRAVAKLPGAVATYIVDGLSLLVWPFSATRAVRPMMSSDAIT